MKFIYKLTVNPFYTKIKGFNYKRQYLKILSKTFYNNP